MADAGVSFLAGFNHSRNGKHAGNDHQFLPTLVGLAAIPLIIKPIDTTVDKLMETSISKVIHGEIKTPEDVSAAFMTTMGSVSVPPAMYLLADVVKPK